MSSREEQPLTGPYLNKEENILETDEVNKIFFCDGGSMVLGGSMVIANI